MLKVMVKRILRRLGFDLRRYSPVAQEGAHRMIMLRKHGINLIFDVGANSGQFGKSLREEGYWGRIVSFEPLSAAREQLVNASRNDPLWEVAPRAAIGSEDGEISINISANSVSSSVLGMLDNHVNAAPESRYVGSERVPLRRLDSLVAEYLRPDSVPLLKIDTQGYEDRILQGARESLPRVQGVQLELSIVPLYQGQKLFDEMLEQLKVSGFQLWAIWPAFTDPASGRLLQVDAIFFRG
jgi:FkbM family methyltransferase